MRAATALFCCLAVVLGVASTAARAAIITGTFTSVGDSDFDLTALGAADWAYWNTTSNPATGGPKTNEKSGGTLISTISPVGGGDVRGSTSGTRPVYDFTFTDGTSPASGTMDNVIGLFNTQLNTVGAGVSLGVTLPTTDEYVVYLWVAGFELTQGTLTATLPGATNFVDTQLSAPGGGSKASALYTLSATANTAGDTLGVSLVLSTSGGGLGHVLVSGVAAAVAPPPPPPPTYYSYEGFSYPTGDLDGQNGGTGWGAGWVATTANESVIAPATPLQYAIPGGALVDGGDRALEISGNSNSLATRTLADPQTGDVYISLLLRWAAGTVGQNDFLSLWFNDMDGPQLGVKGNRDTGNPDAEDFFIRMGGSGAQHGYAGNIADNETTFFLVARIYKDASATYNRMELWLDPLYSDFATPDATVSGALTATQLTSIGLRGVNIDGDDRILLDELRIGTTWDEVVPLGVLIPEPATLGLLGAGLVLLRRRSIRRRRQGTR